MGKKVKTLELLTDQNTYTLVKRLWREYARPYMGYMALGVVLMGLVAASSACLPYLMQPVIDDVFFKKDLGLLSIVAVQVLVLFLVKGFSSYGESVVMGFVGQRIIADIQSDLFRKVIRCDFSFLQKINSGKLVARFVKDVPMLDNAVTGTLTSIVKDSLMVVGYAGVMLYQDWKLACIAVVIFPLAILPVTRIGKRMRKTAGDIQSRWANLTSLVTQSIQGIRLIKGYNLEVHESERAEETIEGVCKLTVKGIRTKSVVHPVMEMLGGASIVSVILYGGHQVIQGHQTTGAFFSFVAALILAYEPVKNLSKLNNNLQESLAALVRVFEIIDKKSEIVEFPSAKSLDISKGEIEFKNVTFSYNEGVEVLKDINLKIKPGQKVALVGPSGGGKSTLLNLIPRFYDPKQGKILINGQDISDVTLESLRASMALVSQEVILFDDTVRKNILFGQLSANDGAIQKAAQDAAAHEFIMGLEEEYNTMIGEHGVKLSGGQRQRLSIARAMLRDAPILLLDEATSALDSESEKRIQEALTKLMKGRTTITIAHRLSTVIDADMICVVDKGQIVATGTHKDLLNSNALYAKLCKVQFSESKVA